MVGIVPIHFPKKKTLFPPEVDLSDFEACREHPGPISHRRIIALRNGIIDIITIVTCRLHA